MKDLVVRKEIVELRSTVFGLVNEVNNLKHKIDSQTNLVDNSCWDYGCGNKYSYRFPLREVFILLLSHLGLELEIQAKEEKIVLKNKEGE